MHKETGGIRLALLIPAYNEEKYIEGVIENSSKYEMDIIIIDDGSIDSTASIVESLISAYSPYLKLIRHSKNLGKGQALITGFDYISLEQWERAQLEFDAYGDPTDIHDIVQTFTDEGTGGEWFTPSVDYVTRGWSYNVY